MPTSPRLADGHPSPIANPKADRPVYTVRGRPGPNDRPTLPAGHPITWDGINAGTCIAGAPYPFPIFWS